jgi:hypothetical protein
MGLSSQGQDVPASAHQPVPPASIGTEVPAATPATPNDVLARVQQELKTRSPLYYTAETHWVMGTVNLSVAGAGPGDKSVMVHVAVTSPSEQLREYFRLDEYTLLNGAILVDHVHKKYTVMKSAESTMWRRLSVWDQISTGKWFPDDVGELQVHKTTLGGRDHMVVSGDSKREHVEMWCDLATWLPSRFVRLGGNGVDEVSLIHVQDDATAAPTLELPRPPEGYTTQTLSPTPSQPSAPTAPAQTPGHSAPAKPAWAPFEDVATISSTKTIDLGNCQTVSPPTGSGVYWTRVDRAMDWTHFAVRHKVLISLVPAAVGMLLLWATRTRATEGLWGRRLRRGARLTVLFFGVQIAMLVALVSPTVVDRLVLLPSASLQRFSDSLMEGLSLPSLYRTTVFFQSYGSNTPALACGRWYSNEADVRRRPDVMPSTTVDDERSVICVGTHRLVVFGSDHGVVSVLDRDIVNPRPVGFLTHDQVILSSEFRGPDDLALYVWDIKSGILSRLSVASPVEKAIIATVNKSQRRLLAIIADRPGGPGTRAYIFPSIVQDGKDILLDPRSVQPDRTAGGMPAGENIVAVRRDDIGQYVNVGNDRIMIDEELDAQTGRAVKRLGRWAFGVIEPINRVAVGRSALEGAPQIAVGSGRVMAVRHRSSGPPPSGTDEFEAILFDLPAPAN